MDRKISFLDRLKQGLRKTREGFVGRLETLLKGKKTIDSDLLDELEELLIEADLGVGVVIELIDNLKERVSQEGMTEPEDVKEVLKQELLSLVGDETVPLRANRDALTVIMVVGVNGTGKTTTVGKLAAMLQSSGSKVLIAAADTFRAAAIARFGPGGCCLRCSRGRQVSRSRLPADRHRRQAAH